MQFEVERKYPVADLAGIELKARELNATFSQPVAQADLYYNHPCRDFAQTDEALRIRRVGEMNFITYKGPKLDTDGKTRRELELPLSLGVEAAAEFGQLLEALGFTRVAEVRKRRRRAVLPYKGRRVEIALDEVSQLGGFVELETIATEATLEAAHTCLASLAVKLNLAHHERRSYLELLLSQPH